MSDSFPVDPPPDAPPPSKRNLKLPLFLGALFLGLGAAAIAYLLQEAEHPVAETQIQPAVPAKVPAPADTSTAEAPGPTSPVDKDEQVRKVVRPLSQEAALETWLNSEDLVRRFTGTATRVAEGESPRPLLTFLAPKGAFLVKQQGGKTLLDPAGYARYDTVARVIASLDADRVQSAYRQLKPMVDQAYGEIAPPGARFEQVLAKAIDSLLAVPVLDEEEELELQPVGITYAYVDPSLEGLSVPQKHLLRMGPANVEKVQNALRSLAKALRLPTTKGGAR